MEHATTAPKVDYGVSVNQPSERPEHNAWLDDTSSRWWHSAMVNRCVSGASTPDDAALVTIGEMVGSRRYREAASTANRSLPSIDSHDRAGNRIDDIRFDQAWHTLVDGMVKTGTPGRPWTHPDTGYLDRTAMFEMWGRLDIGAGCPISMTTAAVPVLRGASKQSPFVADWIKRIVSHVPQFALAGMAMTEPQGGSDLSGVSTIAEEIEGHAENHGFATHRLNGRKWFVSYPVADVILMLAREPELGGGNRGISCFLVPGWLDETKSRRNGLQLQRLKDKLGTRSLPSAEVDLHDAYGMRIGEPGRGIATIMEMVVHTRHDCATGSLSAHTHALQEAIHWCRNRAAFGAILADQPLMRAVLADLAVEREASLALVWETARSFQQRSPLRRLLPAISKFHVTRRSVAACVEALECMGGNGYCEDFTVARLYRDAQVNSTWEGSGNVITLDVFRALTDDPTIIEHFTTRIRELVNRADQTLAGAIVEKIPDFDASTKVSRGFVTSLATVAQAALLVWKASETADKIDDLIARIFVGSRLGAPDDAAGIIWRTFGEDAAMFEDQGNLIIERVLPAIVG